MSLDIGPLQQLYTIRYTCKDTIHQHFAIGVLYPFQRLLDGLRLARQVEDQRLFANHADLTRENRRRYKVQADLTHLLAKAWHHAVGNRQRSIRRHIATRRARAARRQHQVAAHLIDQLAQGLLNDGLLIGDQAGFDFEWRRQRAAQPLFKRRQAFVLVNAAGGAVRDRN